MPVMIPDTNSRLPFRAQGFATLCEGLDYAARGETGFSFFAPRGTLESVLPYRELRDRARDTATRFAAYGLRRGDRVAVIAETGPAFLEVFFACQYAGLIPVPLPLCVNFGGHDAYVGRLRGMALSAGAKLLIASAELLPALEEAAEGIEAQALTLEMLRSLPGHGELAPLRADEPCYVQYSSGSTSAPKGVLVSQRALTANAAAIAVHGLELRAGDRCVSWLPLYHDMGLVGCCLTPVLAQIPVDFLATASFARRPLGWLKLITEQRATISFSPTFGYELCARRAGMAGVEGLDLRSWRVAGIGAEMIRPKVLSTFADTFADAGFDPRAFLPSYGLAETTLAVSMTRPGEGLTVDRVEQGAALERDGMALPATPGEKRPARSFAVCGRPLTGYAIEIRDPKGRILPDRRIGRIFVRGPSLMEGYLDHGAVTRTSLAHGWLDTGDLGYRIDGQLVVTGRSKDLVILNGRNLWPQDIEWAVEQVEGVRSGDVAAFAVSEDGPEQLVVIVQCRATDSEARAALREAARAAVRVAAGADALVILSPVRSLTFTTSGKLSRAAARADYLAGRIRDLAEPRSDPANDRLPKALDLVG